MKQEIRKFLSRGRKGSITYILRCSDSKNRSRGGFQWPEEGPVSAPDWAPEPVCGRGLHGWLLGAGDVSVSDNHASDTALWSVCAVWAADVVELQGKVKVPRAWVVFCGPRAEAVSRIQALGGTAVVYSTNTGGDGSTNTGGDRSTNTGGDGSTNTGGRYSTNTGGHYSTNTGGDESTNTGGHYSTNTGGRYSTNTGGRYSTNTGGRDSTNTGGDRSTNTGGAYSTNTGGRYSTNTGGDRSTNTGGDGSTNTGGHYSTNTGGDESTNTGGHYSTNTGGDESTNTGGYGSILVFRRWDGERDRLVVAYVGENGIEPGVAYRLDSDGNVVKA